MRITVTGAAGRLGHIVCRVLTSAGHTVLGADRQFRTEMPCEMEVVNLVDREACYRLVRNCDALVHLGNIPNPHIADPQTTFNQNVCSNMNIFQAAYEQGVRKFVFASSIQAVFGERLNDFEETDRPLPYLPADGEMPPLAENPYALSKIVGELQVEYYCRMANISGVAIRFPMLLFAHHRRRYMRDTESFAKQAFALLDMRDAAELIACVVAAELPGFRVYFPSSPELIEELGGPEKVAQRFFADVPRRDPAKPLEEIVDISGITRETGWIPKYRAKDYLANAGKVC